LAGADSDCWAKMLGSKCCSSGKVQAPIFVSIALRLPWVLLMSESRVSAEDSGYATASSVLLKGLEWRSSCPSAEFHEGSEPSFMNISSLAWLSGASVLAAGAASVLVTAGAASFLAASTGAAAFPAAGATSAGADLTAGVLISLMAAAS